MPHCQLLIANYTSLLKNLKSKINFQIRLELKCIELKEIENHFLVFPSSQPTPRRNWLFFLIFTYICEWKVEKKGLEKVAWVWYGAVLVCQYR